MRRVSWIAVLAVWAACGGVGTDADLPADDGSPAGRDLQVPPEAGEEIVGDPGFADAVDAEGLVDTAASEEAALQDVAALQDIADLPDVPAPPPWPGPGDGFRRHGTWIVDPLGRAVILHGVNASSSAKYAADHLPWEGPEQFRQLAEAGFDSVRLLTFWGAIMPQDGVVDGAYLDAYVQRVDQAAAAGLLVVVDMHQDLFGFGFHEDGAPRWACDEALYASYVPQSPWYLNYLKPEIRECFMRFYQDDALFAKFRDAWVAVATRLADHPAVVGFDLLNEPNPARYDAATFVSDVWQRRQEELAAAVHAVAPDRLAFFQGSTMAAVGFADPFVPSPDPRVALAPHYYHVLVHDGGSYDPESMEADLDWSLDAIATMQDRMGGVPAWIGEWGGPTTAGNFDRYLEHLLARFTARHWGWAVWSDEPGGGGFSIRNDDGTFKAIVAGQLGHPHARRFPGPVIDEAMDFATGRYVGRFEWRAAAALEAWVPAGTTVMLRPDAGGDPAGCEGAGVPGVRTCARPAGVADGTVYRVSIEPVPDD